MDMSVTELKNLFNITIASSNKELSLEDFMMSYQNVIVLIHNLPFPSLVKLKQNIDNAPKGRDKLFKLCHSLKQTDPKYSNVIESIHAIEDTYREFDELLPKKEKQLKLFIEAQLKQLGMGESEVEKYAEGFYEALTSSIIVFEQMSISELNSFKTNKVDSTVIKKQMLNAIESGAVQ